MTDQKIDEPKQDDETTQPPLLDLPSVEIGQLVVIGNRSGKVLKISDDGQSVQVEFNLTDGDISKRWEYISDIDGQKDSTGEDTEEKVAPALSETDRLQNEICNLRTQLKEVTDDKEHFERCHSIVTRQLEELQAAELGPETTVVQDVAATAFGELQAAKDEIAKLTARVIELENPLLPQRPLVEIKKLSREIAFDHTVQDDAELAKWLAEGYEIIPALSIITFINNETGNEHITFKRVNRQPIQPHHPIAEIDKAFDAQSQRDNPIISQTPYTDLIRQEHTTDEIKQACDVQAFEKACDSFLSSKSKHTPLPALIKGTH